MVDEPYDPIKEEALISLAYLLECTLATYEGLCGQKKPIKRELDRHEMIIKKALTPNVKPLKDYAPRGNPRLDRILKNIPKFGVEGAIAAYINKERYKVGA